MQCQEAPGALRSASSATADLTPWGGGATMRALAGGVLVSTWEIRQRRHAEDDALASLIIASKQNANEELALAA